MQFIKGKIASFSVLLLACGYVALSPAGVARERGHESHAVQAAPNRTQPNNIGPSERSQNWQRNNAGRWNNGQRWNNNNGRWNDNFARNRFAGRDRDRDRDRDRSRHHRSRGNFGFYWGTPVYPYYNQGFYYSVPNGYYTGNSYDIGYSDGLNAGRYDRINGNIYNPRQYERSGDPDYFSGFVDGYEDGYR